mgnify:CR=1 FL=1
MLVEMKKFVSMASRYAFIVSQKIKKSILEKSNIKIMIYNKKVNHKILIKRLRELKNDISVDYNMVQRLTYYDFINEKFTKKYDTWITYNGDYLVIKLYKKCQKEFVDIIIIKKKDTSNVKDLI